MAQQIKPEKFTLKMSEVMELFNALQAFDNYTVQVADDKTAQVPFALPPLTRVAIALNIKGLRDLVQTSSETDKALREQHLAPTEPFDEKTADVVQRVLRNDAVKKFNSAIQEVMDGEHEVKLRRLKISDITGGGRPASPNALAVLSTIIDFEDEDDKKQEA